MDHMKHSHNVMYDDIDAIQMKLDIVENKVEEYDDELDKLESNSRRNNVMFHGISEGDGEMSRECTDKLISVLNDHVKTKTWQRSDIGRAHRLGMKKNDPNKPRPLIAKLNESYDKVGLLKARPTLKEAGIGVSSDLTSRQRARLQELKFRGQKGYFKQGKLYVIQEDGHSEEYKLNCQDQVVSTPRTPRVFKQAMRRGRGGRGGLGNRLQDNGRGQISQGTHSHSTGESERKFATSVNNDKSTYDPDENSYFSFLCWNVNGLLGKINDSCFINYLQKFQIVCLVETFLNENYPGNWLDGFDIYYRPALKLSNFGRLSGGVCICVKKSISDLCSLIKTDIDNTLCLNLSKDLFKIDKDIRLVCTYIPPAGSSYYSSKPSKCNLDQLEEFLISNVNDQITLICGDLNARTGEENNPQDDTDDQAFSYENYVTDDDDIELEDRKSHDTVVNRFGRMLLELCYVFQLYILNGRVYGDKNGEFTFCSQQGCSVNDFYFIP